MKVLPDAVCWHEGMQLLPQHFQLQALRAEVLAAHFAQAGNPWFWGVSQLEIDPAALSAGLVRIQALEAILPDGLPVSLQPGSGTTLELDVGPAAAAAANAQVTLYLAVNPLGRSGQVLPLQGRLQSVVGDAVPDLASGEYPEPILVWRPHLRLVTESERVDSVCLPLLRVAKEAGGFVRQPYAPPAPQVLPQSLLGQAVAELCARGREKCQFLAGRLRQAEQAGNADDIEELRRQLAALWARLPEVEAALNSRVASPQTLHGLLAGMAGTWCALDAASGVPPFAPWITWNSSAVSTRSSSGCIRHWTRCGWAIAACRSRPLPKVSPFACPIPRRVGSVWWLVCACRPVPGSRMRRTG